jgi:hypothetical protein
VGAEQAMRQLVYFLAGGLALGLGVPPHVGAEETKPCSAPEYRQFDFWLGKWNVTDAQGKPAGKNEIKRLLSDCVLHESWKGGGSVGQSFNIYDARTGRWHQTWVDDRGQLLQLDGGLEGERMVLRGTRPGRDGKPVLHEISWTPNADGTLTQHWRATKDDGRTWRDLFVGTYRRR